MPATLAPADPKRRLAPTELAQLSEQVRGVELNPRQEQALRCVASRLGTERGYDYMTAGGVAQHLTAWTRREGIHVVGFRGGGRIDGFNAYPTLVALEKRQLVTRAITDRERLYGRGYSAHWRVTDAGVAWLAHRDR